MIFYLICIFRMNIDNVLGRVQTISKQKEKDLISKGIINARKCGLGSDGTYAR